MEYYLAMKRNKLLIHATTWKNLQRIMLSEKANLQRLYSMWFHYITCSNDRNEQISGCQGLMKGWVGREVEVAIKRQQSLLGQNCSASDCSKVNVLVVMMVLQMLPCGCSNIHVWVVTVYYRSARCYHWRKVSKQYIGWGAPVKMAEEVNTEFASSQLHQNYK